MNAATKRLTRLSVFIALGLALLFIGAVLPSAKLTCAAVSGLFCAIALIMYGYGWAAAVFSITALLALWLLPNKLCAVSYASLFGFYPLCKALFESKLKSKTLCRTAKLVLLSAIFWLWWCFFQSLWLAPAENAAQVIFSHWYILWPCCAAAFIIYDICLSFLIQIYIERISGYFK